MQRMAAEKLELEVQLSEKVNLIHQLRESSLFDSTSPVDSGVCHRKAVSERHELDVVLL
jgi:hypothetical protein